MIPEHNRRSFMKGLGSLAFLLGAKLSNIPLPLSGRGGGVIAEYLETSVINVPTDGPARDAYLRVLRAVEGKTLFGRIVGENGEKPSRYPSYMVDSITQRAPTSPNSPGLHFLDFNVSILNTPEGQKFNMMRSLSLGAGVQAPDEARSRTRRVVPFSIELPHLDRSDYVEMLIDDYARRLMGEYSPQPRCVVVVYQDVGDIPAGYAPRTGTFEIGTMLTRESHEMGSHLVWNDAFFGPMGAELVVR